MAAVLYKNRNWLENQYINLKKSQYRIAKEQNVRPATIRRWLKNFYIPKRLAGMKRLEGKEMKNTLYNYSWLKNQYINLEKSASQISREINCSHSTVLRQLERIKISRRKIKGKYHGNWNNNQKISKGYIKIRDFSHPRADSGGYVFKHILVAEEKYGRFIKRSEPIHHINGNKVDNSPDNLYLCKDNTEHKKIHNMTKLIKPLLDKGIIIFDKKEGVYKLNE